MAGTDTTSNSTTMLIYLLAQNPSVEEKLRKEIDEHFKSPLDIAEITYDSLKKLTYYDDVFKETLRMYSPNAGIFARYATKDHYIGKIPIKKGALVSVKIKPNHFKEEFF
jgi:cytochrome P450 family 6